MATGEEIIEPPPDSVTAQKPRRRFRNIRGAVSAASEIPVLVSRDNVPLSSGQERLWFLQQFEPSSVAYNCAENLVLSGPLNISALQLALNEILRRHEALRTFFPVQDDSPRQQVSAECRLSLEIVDLSDFPADSRESQARQLAAAEAAVPFCLETGPMFRGRLLRLDECTHWLLLTAHHIAYDGHSFEILLQELASLYESFSLGAGPRLAALKVQYADYAVWQRQNLAGSVHAERLSYWKQQLAGAPAVLELPADESRPALPTYRGGRVDLAFDLDTMQAAQDIAQREGATLFMVLLTAWKILLARLSGQTDLVVGTPVAGRNRTELEGLIGFFVNTLALRTDLSGNPTFLELLARVRRTAIDAYAHQDLPFEKLVEELHPDRHLSHSPIFQVLFVLHPVARVPAEMAGIKLQPRPPEITTAKFDLTLSLEETARGLQGYLEFNADIFTRETVDRLVSQLKVLLAGIVA
ncbi:MAG: non-ribosomal peptide synthetase, partial [Planctomycetes bacterium]|nr:non-ribosomal peptide synthetase [Planctomycetota bacterium]